MGSTLDEVARLLSVADLWATSRDTARRAVRPLAERMRPRTLDEFAGQKHILGAGKLLRRMIQADAITSLILHGPPGTGKTTLAELIAVSTKRRFERENAASVGVKRIRELIDDAAKRVENGGPRTILFLDEIHRFSRAQQDVLLADVERGLITLIGATTENPLFAVNSALVSRSTLFRLETLSEEDIAAVLDRAVHDAQHGFGSRTITLTDEAKHVWAIKCDGDARRALTALEVAVLSAPAAAGTAENPLLIDRQMAEDSIQQKAAAYDASGDAHYDSASALIKSIRGSDPDAALYWIARMLEGGEDPRFIARRMAILASEDIGNADPRAIMIAQAAWDLVERIGMPEARITLSQCATYLAVAPKSNASYVAIDAALKDVREGRTIPVPVYLRDPNSSPIDVGVRTKHAPGEKYVYSQDTRAGEHGGVTGQDYLGVPKIYYEPSSAGSEAAIAKRLEELRAMKKMNRG